MTEILVAVALAVVTVLLFLVLGGRRRSEPAALAAPEAKRREPCPLCGSALGPGERVHSVVFATKTEDKIMEISGCPHCKPPASLPRLCPVCKKQLKPTEVVTARVFERKNEVGARKTHVHVLGCPRCRT